jgi:uncharacterized protein
MKLEQSFTVTAPVDQVWAALVDVERIAPCLPGAEITGQDDQGAYTGQFSVKLGPTTASYRGSLKMESVDEATHTATMRANGTDKRGQGGAHATIVSTLHEEGADTRVEVDTDFTITGRLARFGRSGMIEDISKRLLRDFSSCLEATITSGPPEAAGHAEAAPAAAPDEAGAALASAGGAASEAGAAAATAPSTPAAAPSGGPAAPAPGAEAPGASREGSVPPPAAPRPAPQPAKPIRGFSLFFSVLWERTKRLFSRKR